MRQKEIPLLFVLLVLLAGVIPAFAAGDAGCYCIQRCTNVV